MPAIDVIDTKQETKHSSYLLVNIVFWLKFCDKKWAMEERNNYNDFLNWNQSVSKYCIFSLMYFEC